MSDVHAVGIGTPQRDGACCWSHAFEDVLLRCFGAHFPGEPECCDHYIARVQASPDPDVVPDSEPVRFGPVQVPAPEVTL